MSCFPSFIIFQPTSHLSFLKWTMLPLPTGLCTCCPLYLELSCLLIQLTPHMRSQSNHHFLRDASMLSQIPLGHSSGSVSFLQSNYNTYKVTFLCVIICSMSIPLQLRCKLQDDRTMSGFFSPHSPLYHQFQHRTQHITL